MSDGVATFTNLADDTAETISLKFTSAGLTSPSTNIVVSPAAAYQLVIQTQPSLTATAGRRSPPSRSSMKRTSTATWRRATTARW